MSRSHYTDLHCGAMNDPACMRVFKRMEETCGFEIVENPDPGDFLMDYSFMFMYPHEFVFPDTDLDPDSVRAALSDMLNP